MDSTLDIIPFRSECFGSVAIPGSKSISNRALLLSAISKCKTTLTGVLKSQDVEVMLKALKTLGVEIYENWDLKEIEIMGCGGIMPQKNQALYVGNAGTVARFLTALLAIQEESSYTLDGSAEMRRRPIGQLLSFFQNGGVGVIYNQQHGHFPFTLNTRTFNSNSCLLYTSPSPRDATLSRMPSSA